ncbi:carboxylesterase family protein [Pseudoalteromonas sp. SR44-8]|uniref:carboxylesterase/lipase family protein n=1 Tax=Pseudoalteromonas sp. SR44-8 TaxID=2760933 RepID=UPI001604409E|nr:carboxylesterase family protein [Pseudoalteromonas sp. SR44-8]MBB1300252.1 carboxylesterase family protein [Pseudoalteromonas sp. SR44-8]
MNTSTLKRLLWATFFTATTATVTAVNAEPLIQVTVAQGKLQGTAEHNLAVFKGVPFAKPPVGELRWKAPQPAEKWQGVRKAQEYAPAPIQAGNPVSGISEDSLYLNIWTPAESSVDKLPVMVWIYGGGFSFGSSSDPIFDGTELANKGVIVVSIAYRVGQLGFLAHPELNKESPVGVSGNYGLLDQLAALKWLKQNISEFGGDANNLTIAGESAGGISVSMLAASPLAKGLFNKVISQSGGSFGPTRIKNYPGENMSTLQQAQTEGFDYVKQFGTTSIAQLRKMSAKTFIPKGWSLPGGWPIVDGYVIKDDQYKLYQQGKFNDVPALIGYNSDEGVSFVWDPDVNNFVDGVKTRFGQFAPSTLEAYPVAKNSIPRSARNLVRDAAFGWHTWSWAKLQTEHGRAPVYLYYFDHHPERKLGGKDEDYGSGHGHEIAYMFKNLNKADPNVTKNDLKMSDIMATYWTNFAKNSNPNDDALPNWPAFNNDKPSTMYFQQQAKVGPVPDKQALETLDQYFKWRRTPAGEKWANQVR